MEWVVNFLEPESVEASSSTLSPGVGGDSAPNLPCGPRMLHDRLSFLICMMGMKVITSGLL